MSDLKSLIDTTSVRIRCSVFKFPHVILCVFFKSIKEKMMERNERGEESKFYETEGVCVRDGMKKQTGERMKERIRGNGGEKYQ